jgi:hypothetical protein
VNREIGEIRRALRLSCLIARDIDLHLRLSLPDTRDYDRGGNCKNAF